MSAPATESPRFRADALPIAEKFISFFESRCHRCVIAGSLRRRKEMVKDIEILFVPKIVTVPDPADMFGGRIEVPATEAAIAALLGADVIEKRPNKKLACTWGAQNKLARHVASEIGVDLFATTEECFRNALFVRTGRAS